MLKDVETINGIKRRKTGMPAYNFNFKNMSGNLSRDLALFADKNRPYRLTEKCHLLIENSGSHICSCEKNNDVADNTTGR